MPPPLPVTACVAGGLDRGRAGCAHRPPQTVFRPRLAQKPRGICRSRRIAPQSSAQGRVCSSQGSSRTRGSDIGRTPGGSDYDPRCRQIETTGVPSATRGRPRLRRRCLAPASRDRDQQCRGIPSPTRRRQGRIPRRSLSMAGRDDIASARRREFRLLTTTVPASRA
jgi:hypothetical protein